MIEIAARTPSWKFS